VFSRHRTRHRRNNGFACRLQFSKGNRLLGHAFKASGEFKGGRLAGGSEHLCHGVAMADDVNDEGAPKFVADAFIC